MRGRFMKKYDLILQVKTLDLALQQSKLQKDKFLNFLEYNIGNDNLPYRQSLEKSIIDATNKTKPPKRENPFNKDEIGYTLNLINQTDYEKATIEQYINDYLKTGFDKLDILNQEDKTIISNIVSLNMRNFLGFNQTKALERISDDLSTGNFKTSYSNIVKISNNGSSTLKNLFEENIIVARRELEEINNYNLASEVEDVLTDLENLFEAKIDVADKQSIDLFNSVPQQSEEIQETQEIEEELTAVEEIQESNTTQEVEKSSIDNILNKKVTTFDEAFAVVKDSFSKNWELKQNGHNISGAYDTFAFETEIGAITFGYNMIGRRLGNNDDSKVEFFLANDNDLVDSIPMSFPIRSTIENMWDTFMDEQRSSSLILNTDTPEPGLNSDETPTYDYTPEVPALTTLENNQVGHYWMIEWNESNSDHEIPNLDGQIIDEEVLTTLIKIDNREFNNRGYYKCKVLELQDGEIIGIGRMDLGDGSRINGEGFVRIAETLSIDVPAKEFVDSMYHSQTLDEVAKEIEHEREERIIAETANVPGLDESDKKVEEVHDFVFPDDMSNFYPKTNPDKVTANIKAIRLIKKLSLENRQAIDTEQEVLARYVGWGGLGKEFFDENNPRFKTEREELKALVTSEEYNAMDDSMLTAYYTDPDIINSMYKTIERLGFEGGRILDPALGTGNFFAKMPDSLRSNSELYGVELDNITGAIAQQLTPSANIQVKGFETTNFSNDSMDVVVTNVPFNNFSINDDTYDKSYRIHDYFIKKSLDLVHDGGIVAVISSTGTMDKKSGIFRREIAEQANLLGAVRLPNNAFKKIAGTDVTTDILFFQKNVNQLEMSEENIKFQNGENRYSSEKTEFNKKRWIQSLPFVQEDGTTLTDLSVNEYFNTNTNRAYDFGNYYINPKEEIEGRTLGINTVQNFNGHTLSVKATPETELIPLLDKALLKGVKGVYFGTATPTFEKAVQVAPEVPEEVLGMNVEPFTHIVVNGNVYYHYSDGIRKKTRDSSYTITKSRAKTAGAKKFLESNKDIIYDSSVNYDDNDKYLSTTYYYQKDMTAENVERISEMLDVKKAVLAVTQFQQKPDFTQEEFNILLSQLNVSYDKFESKYGAINSKDNHQLMQEDDYYPLIASIENSITDELGNVSYTKGDIFRMPTIRVNYEVGAIKTAKDALYASLNFQNKVDLDYMAEIYGETQENIIDELTGEIYINPEKYLNQSPYYWELKSEYFSGDVKTKLEFIQNPENAEKLELALSSEDFIYQLDKHYADLESVQPVDFNFNDISFRIGSKWIPIDVYHSFAVDILGQRNPKITFSEISSTYKIDSYSSYSVVNNQTYGVKSEGRRSYTGVDLMETLLNLKPPVIRYTDSEGKTHVDEAMSASYRGKANDLQNAFQDYVKEFKSDIVLEQYNKLFNRTIAKEFDGANLTVNGLNKNIELREHQKGGIARILSERRALLAHEVGAGKTLTMLAAGMKMKELGMIHKPLYVVPSNLTSQFGSELLNYFPNAKPLVTTKYDFLKSHRKEFVARIANGNYDAIVIGDSQFERIPISQERQRDWIENQLTAYQSRLQETDGIARKDLKLRIRNLESKLEKLNNLPKDNLLNFEELGIDFLFVDEAHNYKNIAPDTAMSDVVGINKTTSKRAIDMTQKVEYIQEINDGRGVVFATGTPISNSISEIYTMMNFLEPDYLKANGLRNFDDFVGNFGKIKTDIEATVSNTYKQRTRFESFVNLPEMISLFKNVADIKLTADLNLNLPKATNISVVVDKGESLEEFTEDLLDRSENIEAGFVDPSEDNMLKITTESKASSLDMRLLDSVKYKDEVPAKLIALVDNLYKEYLESNERKGTQMIFSDLGTPSSKRTNPDGSANSFTVYDEIARLLVEKGVPRDEIAFIQTAKNEEQKNKMFAKMRRGEIRFLIASTSNGGTGVNVQNKMVAIHHLDIPWRPSDLIQRNGRCVRQGNENSHVNVYQYSTKGTLDAFMWQTLAIKSKFNEQVMRGDKSVREMDDLSNSSVGMTELQASVADNPFMLELAKLKVRTEQLGQERNNYYSTKNKNKSLIVEATKNIEQSVKRMQDIKGDIAQAQTTEDLPFNVLIDGLNYDKKAVAGDALIAKIKNSSMDNRVINLGQYRGFDIMFHTGDTDNLMNATNYNIYLKRDAQHTLNLSLESGIGTMASIDNRINSIQKEEIRLDSNIEMNKKLRSDLESSLNAPFPKETEYTELTAKKVELESRVNEANLEYKEKRQQRKMQRELQKQYERSSEVLVEHNLPDLDNSREDLSKAKALAKNVNISFSEDEEDKFISLSSSERKAILTDLQERNEKENKSVDIEM